MKIDAVMAMHPDQRRDNPCLARVRQFWRAQTGIFLGTWLALIVAGRSHLFRDPGTFWHIVVGERILASGQLIHTDLFSFTFGGKPWIAQWWLAECALGLAHRLDGLDSVLLVTVTALAALYTWIAHRLLRAGIHWLVAVLIMALAIAASAYHFHPRPHLVTIMLLGWTFARLCDFEAGRVPLWRLFWLVPLFVLWANAHGGMVGGVGTVALAAAGWWLAKLIGQDSPLGQPLTPIPSPLAARGEGRRGEGCHGVSGDRREVSIIPLGFLVVACGLTALVNPYGLELPRAWLSLMWSPVLPRVVQEHSPLRLCEPTGWTVLLFGFVYLAALAGVFPKWPRVTWLIPVVWLCLAWTRVRHGPLFAITAAIALGDMFPHIRWVSWLTRHGSELLRIRRPDAGERLHSFGLKPALLPVGLVLASVVFQLCAVPVPVLGHGWARLDRSHWPVELLPELQEYARGHPEGTPIFNDMLFGGFLIYYTPNLRIFIDDRCELYGDDGVLAYAHASNEDPAQLDRWAEQYGFDLALTISGSGFDRYLRGASGWTIVRETRAATLHRRIEGE